MIHAFTVDVEDYFQVDAFSRGIDRSQWDGFESRVVANTRRLLQLLDNVDVTGTFFVLGYVAHRHPELIREIQRAGHEIGCHGYWHRPIYRMTADEFADDLKLATSVLEDVAGEPVRAFRAPNFSVRRDTLWALDILADHGYSLDSSIFPIVHDQYGIPDADPAPHVRELSAAKLWEFPPTVYQTRIGRIPIAGGGYFRLLPYAVTRRLMARAAQREQLPLMFYIHPWELDPDQPRMRGPWKSRFRHYQNLQTTEPKLKRLLRDFRFGTVSAALASAGLGFEEPVVTSRDAPVRTSAS